MAEEKKDVTIYDIAKEAGVSVATVSRVLNKSANVKSSKEKAVLKIIEKYSYVPSNLARGLSSKRSMTIGIIVPDIRNAYFANLQTYCEIEAEKHGYTLLMANTLGEKKHTIRAINSLMNKSIDGMIQLGGDVDRVEIDKEYLSVLDKISKKVPYVSTGNYESLNAFRIKTNEYAGSRELTEYFIKKGHKDILFIGGVENDMSTYEKWRAYMDTMREYGIRVSYDSILKCSYNMEDGYHCVMDFWKSAAQKPTAVICINELAAIGVIHGARELGLSIPEDLSIAAFDDTYLSKLTMPQLTVMGYDYKKLAKELINKMVSAIEGTAYENEEIEMKLTKRETVLTR